MSKVAKILKFFTATISQLEKLASSNRVEAGIKTAKADVLDVQAGELLDEAAVADKAAKRLKGLLEEPA